MRHLVVLLGILLFSSCFEVREEVWIHRDGSGRLEIDLTVPARAIALAGGEAELRRSVDAWFAANPQVVLENFALRPSGSDGDRTISLAASAPSLPDLVELPADSTSEGAIPSVEHIAGTFNVNVSPTGIDFHRRIDLGDAFGLAAFAISPAQRRERKLEYTVHLPTASTSHNADEVLDGGRTLIWRRNLGQALTGPVEMRFQAPLPYPAGVLVAGGLLLAIAGVFVVRHLRRRR